MYLTTISSTMIDRTTHVTTKLTSLLWQGHAHLNYSSIVGLTLRTQSANILAYGLYMHSAMCQYMVGSCSNSEANQAFRVNPCLLSSNKCRPHLSTYITHSKGRKGRC